MLCWATSNEELTSFIYAAFLNSLRANLSLGDDSTPPSLVSTPDSLRPTTMASTSSLPPPSPSPLTQPPAVPDAPSDPLENVPPLTTTLATTTDDKIEALRLVVVASVVVNGGTFSSGSEGASGTAGG